VEERERGETLDGILELEEREEEEEEEEEVEGTEELEEDKEGVAGTVATSSLLVFNDKQGEVGGIREERERSVGTAVSSSTCSSGFFNLQRLLFSSFKT